MLQEEKTVLHAEELELFECKRQPGRLKISPTACARRYLLAQKSSSRFGCDDFAVALKWGLEKCRTCSQGLAFAELMKATDPGRKSL
jgi:hypothetical protein